MFRNNAIDLNELLKFALPFGAVLLIVIYVIIRRFVMAYVELQRQVKVQEHAIKMRQGAQQNSPQQQNFVRKTDLFEQLNPQQKLLHQQAEALAAAKKFPEAARIFESINFQRRAIDLLEQNGYIEDAAQMLIRMKAIYRAAVVYERNNKFIRAAECFIQDQKFDSAGRSYERAAAQDYHFFQKAAECYAQAGMTDQTLETYAKILNTDEVMRLALGGVRFEFLANYMADPYNAKAVLEKLQPEQAKNLIAGLSARPAWVQSMSVWVLYRQDLAFFGHILEFLVDKRELTQLFWSHISVPHMKFLVQQLSQAPQTFSAKVCQYHSRDLMGTERQPLGELMQKLATLPPPTL